MTIADINTLTRYLCDADTTNYTAANLLITVNNAYEEVITKILKADGRWQWDDDNQTDFPIATTLLVSGQKDYQFDATMLEVEGVEVLDVNGNYYPLTPIDIDDIKAQGLDITNYQSTSGKPAEYDLSGNSIVLYPAPDAGVSVTLAAGLKVRFKRGPALFTSAEVTTGTKAPGFASVFHEVLAYKAAIPYCIKNHPDRVQAYESKAARIMGDLELFYGNRMKDEQPTMTMSHTYKRK